MKRIREILRTGRWGRGVARSAVRAVLGVVFGLSMVGCAGFERDWRRAVAAPATGRPADGGGAVGVTVADGAWTGRWVSGANGHEGRLRCVVSGAAGSEAAFRYWASWGIFSGTFPTRQPVSRRADGSVRSTGTWRLPGWAGGEYTYDVTIRGNQFFGTWRCARDHGRFEMTRAATVRDPGAGGRRSPMTVAP